MKQISLDLNLITTTARQPEFHAQMQRTTPWTALVVLIASLDDSTLLRFCHWLEKREWANHIFAAARSRLTVQGLPPKSAPTMDGSSIAATSPAGNTDKDRDSKIHSSPKGTRWCFSKMLFALLIPRMARHTLIQVHECVCLITRGIPEKIKAAPKVRMRGRQPCTDCTKRRHVALSERR